MENCYGQWGGAPPLPPFESDTVTCNRLNEFSLLHKNYEPAVPRTLQHVLSQNTI